MTDNLRLNHYQVLGIPTQAEPAEIEAAYQKWVQRFHPDHLPADTSPSLRERAQAEFARIEMAYQTLSHHLRRKAYDISLSLESSESSEIPPPALPPRRDVPPLPIPEAPPKQDWLFAVVMILAALMGLGLLLAVVPSLLRATPTPALMEDAAPPITWDPPEPAISQVSPLEIPPPSPDPLSSTVVSREQVQKWVETVAELRPIYSRIAAQLDQTQDPEQRQRLQAEFEAAASAVISQKGLTPEQYRLISQLARENPQVQATIRSLTP